MVYCGKYLHFIDVVQSGDLLNVPYIDDITYIDELLYT